MAAGDKGQLKVALSWRELKMVLLLCLSRRCLQPSSLEALSWPCTAQQRKNKTGLAESGDDSGRARSLVTVYIAKRALVEIGDRGGI
jgi:hypothetical protein